MNVVLGVKILKVLVVLNQFKKYSYKVDLQSALREFGIGAKTRLGYGIFE